MPDWLATHIGCWQAEHDFLAICTHAFNTEADFPHSFNKTLQPLSSDTVHQYSHQREAPYGSDCTPCSFYAR